MDKESMERIDELIEKVREASLSERNLKKIKEEKDKIICSFGLEEPIASTELFGYDANVYYSDPYFYIEQTLRQKLWRWENLDDDIPISLEIDAKLGYYAEYTFMGMEVSFNRKGVPLIQEDHPLSKSADLKLLKPVDFKTSGWMPRILKWYDDINEISRERLKVIFYGWYRGPLDLAMQLRGYNKFIIDAMENPDFIDGLLKFITEQRLRWYDGYCGYFARPMPAAFISDDWVNIPYITPEIFRDFVLPRYFEIERHQGGVDQIHSCGDQTPIQHDLLKIKSLKVVEVSPWTDLKKSVENVPPEKPLIISLHPNDVLFASAGEMENKLKFIADTCGKHKYRIGTAGLTPIFGEDNEREFIYKIRTWVDIAMKVLGRRKTA